MCSGDAVRSSVCSRCVLCILVTATLSVILLPVGYRAVVVWRKLAGVLCKAGARKKGPKSNLHQHCEWTSGKRAPLGCPRHVPRRVPRPCPCTTGVMKLRTDHLFAVTHAAEVATQETHCSCTGHVPRRMPRPCPCTRDVPSSQIAPTATERQRNGFSTGTR